MYQSTISFLTLFMINLVINFYNALGIVNLKIFYDRLKGIQNHTHYVNFYKLSIKLTLY